MVTRRTVTSSGNVTCSHGLVPCATASPLAVNHELCGLSSKASVSSQPCQTELALSSSLPGYLRTRVFLLSVVISGTFWVLRLSALYLTALLLTTGPPP